MTVRLAKKCPQCDQENVVDAKICFKCAAPLHGVRAVAISDEPPVSANTLAAAEPTPVVGVTRVVQSDDGFLESFSDPTLRFRVWHGAVVGREPADVNLTKARNSDTISRRHARFLRRGPDWFICNEPHITNFTEVNGERVEEADERGLQDGDEVSLGLSRFVFRAGA